MDNVPDRFGMLKVKQPNVEVTVEEVGVRSGKRERQPRNVVMIQNGQFVMMY